MVDDAPCPKRARVESEQASGSKPGIEEVVNAKLLAPESRESLRAAYQGAEPYNHTVLKDIFNVELLKQIKEEIINNIQATYKETDLFKVFQTGDIGNLDTLDSSNAEKLPGLYKLKSVLYSEFFREFVTGITGCGNLSNRIDCSCNVYSNGCHLLCHDDVIGKRRVSWIIYLTDPESAWEEKDGGALELYPPAKGQQYVPDVVPSLSHLPTFNTMAMFTVLPGYSFHSVQEVFAEDKPRMSISGWYHADAAPEGMEHATLSQLQLKSGEDAKRTYTLYKDPTDPLSAEDRALLSRFVNPAYLVEAGWAKVQAKFKEDGSVQLKRFLKKELADKISARTKAEDAADGVGRGRVPSYQAGVRGDWNYVGPPHKQRYLHLESAASEEMEREREKEKDAGELLAEIRSELFESGAFAKLLREMTTITYLGHQGDVRRFRAGLDYTVAHYGIITKDPRLDVVLTFVDDESDADAAAWDSGEMGGFEAYLLAETDGETAAAAEVYRQDAEESGVLNVSGCNNGLNIVLRDEGLMRFVKYVSYAAPGSRWDVAMEYLPEDDSDDEEEEKEEEEVKEEVKEEEA